MSSDPPAAEDPEPDPESDSASGEEDPSGEDKSSTDGETSTDGESSTEGESSTDEESSTEDEIRWAAFSVLVRDGYDAFTTQAVADEAGVSQSLVHYYFDTKEDLVFSMYENGLEHLADEIESRTDAADPRERLLELARYTLRGEGNEDFERAVEFSRLLLEIESQAPYDDRLRDAIEYDVTFLRDYVVAAAEEGIESGAFREVDPEAFGTLYVAAVREGQNWRGVFADDDHVEPLLAGLEAVIDDYLGATDP